MGAGFPDYSIGFVGAVTVPNGGTGLQKVPVNALVYGNDFSPLGVIAPVAGGAILVCQGAAFPPAWQTDIRLTNLAFTNCPTNLYTIQISTLAPQTADIIYATKVGTGVVFRVDCNGNVFCTSVNFASPLGITSGGTGAASCAAGDLLIGSGANTAAWGKSPGCRVYNSTDIVLTTNVLTTLSFNSEVYDNGSMHDNATNPSRLTMTKAGVYLVRFHGTAWNASGLSWQIQLLVGGITYISLGYPNFPAGDNMSLDAACLWHFSANEYVEVQVMQTTGGNQTINGGTTYGLEFSAQWLGG